MHGEVVVAIAALVTAAVYGLIKGIDFLIKRNGNGNGKTKVIDIVAELRSIHETQAITAERQVASAEIQRQTLDIVREIQVDLEKDRVREKVIADLTKH